MFDCYKIFISNFVLIYHELIFTAGRREGGVSSACRENQSGKGSAS